MTINLNWLLYDCTTWFLCTAEGDGDGNGGGGSGYKDIGGGGPDGSGGSDGGGGDPGRPDGLQDKFWDTEKKAVNLVALSGAYNDLSVAYTKKTEDIRGDIDKDRFKDRPATPDDYTAAIPDDYEVPPGFDIKLRENHPLIAFWRNHAFNAGLGQDAFTEGVSAFLDFQKAELPVIADEAKKLGENGTDRFERAASWMTGVVGQDQVHSLGALLVTANGVQMVEKMMEKGGASFDLSGGGGSNVDADDNIENQPMFDNKTRRMMGEDGYQKGEATALTMVRDRWKKAHPGSSGPNRNAPGGRG